VGNITKPFRFLRAIQSISRSSSVSKKEEGGKFDMGFEKLREQIFATQKRLGVPPKTTLTAWPDGAVAIVGRGPKEGGRGNGQSQQLGA
jgi:hypothetical protein